MILSEQGNRGIASVARRSARDVAAEAVREPDPSWSGFYRAGGVCAFLYVLLSLIIPAVMVFVEKYDYEMDAAVYAEFVASHTAWWTVLQMLVIGSSFLAIVVFMALFPALKHLNKSRAALGAMIGIVCQILFLAYTPVLMGIVYLSERYVEAGDESRLVYLSAVESLIAQNNAFNPLYEAVFAVGILLLSTVMLKGVFPKAVAWVGIANAPAAFIALALFPVIGVGYFWWWVLFIIWFVAVGWKLYRLGGASARPHATASLVAGAE